jgi:hypothetical protein
VVKNLTRLHMVMDQNIIIFIPSPTKLRRDIVTLPSVRHILVNTLGSFKAINILSFESLLLPTFGSPPEACLSHFTMHQVHKVYLYCDMYCRISFYLQKSIRFTINKGERGDENIVIMCKPRLSLCLFSLINNHRNHKSVNQLCCHMRVVVIVAETRYQV